MPFQRLFRASRNTLDGLRALWSHEQAFRQEVYLSIFLLPVIYILPASSVNKLILILLLILLLLIETINSAIEVIIDRISIEFHEKSKMAKDMGSAAVGLTLLMNIMAWCYVLFSVFQS